MTPAVRWLPRPADYDATLTAMRDFTHGRTADTPDEIWLVEHSPVYTLGQAGKPEHVLAPGNIPLVHSDRGGQVTYHGPGQVVGYGLIDLRRRGLFVKEYVALLEDAVIAVLQEYGLMQASRLPGAPGVYVPFDAVPLRPEQGASETRYDNDASALPTRESGTPSRQDSPQDGEGLSLNGRPMAKIAALGIKVSNGRAYHGVSLNVNMNLQPFLGINPCGYQGLMTTDLAGHGVSVSLEQAGADLTRHWLTRLPPIR